MSEYDSTADITVATTVIYPECSCGYRGYHSIVGHWLYRLTGSTQLRALWYRMKWGS